MYICYDCKNTFNFPAVLVDEYVEVWGRKSPRTADFCPHCHSQDFEELWKKCDCCGETITGKYIETADDMCICEQCYVEHNIDERG